MEFLTDVSENDEDYETTPINRSRTNLREKCGFIERFVKDNTYCLTCSYCARVFELWDWQQFVEHMSIEHGNELKFGAQARSWKKRKRKNALVEEKNKPTNDETIVENVAEECLMETYSDVDELIEKIEQVEEEHLENLDETEILENITTENSIDSFIEQDVIVENVEESVIYNEYEIANADDEEQLQDSYDEDEHDNDNQNQTKTNESTAVIDFKRTEPERLLRFLQLLREYPVLWHARRYGPVLYDQVMEKFLQQFDPQMSAKDFRTSMDNVRHQYRRFTPLTGRGRVKLQNDAELCQRIQIIKEIADKLSKPYAYHCDKCSFYFLDEDRMLTHKFLKHKIGDLPYICSCGIRFAAERQKEEHEHQHKINPRFSCELCDASFIFRRLLRDHMNDCHPETQENPLPYECAQCGAKFPTIIKRAHHMERHALPKYTCNICNQSFKTAFRFKVHLKGHQDQRDWVCEHCGRAFLEKRSLNSHRFRVHQDGGFKCKYCRTFFAYQESLDAHNKKFHPNGTNLDRMKKIRAIHNSKAYNKRPYEIKSSRVYKCKACDMDFQRMWELVKHKRTTGHDLQMFNCPNCESVLSSAKTLVGHLQRIHKLPVTKFSDIKQLILDEDCSIPEEFIVYEAFEMD